MNILFFACSCSIILNHPFCLSFIVCLFFHVVSVQLANLFWYLYNHSVTRLPVILHKILLAINANWGAKKFGEKSQKYFHTRFRSITSCNRNKTRCEIFFRPGFFPIVIFVETICFNCSKIFGKV